MRFRMVERPQQLTRGARMRYQMAPFGLPVRWLAEIVEWAPPRAFVDQQVEGPYKRWRHRHQILPFGELVEIRDQVEYQLPAGVLGMLADRLGHRLFLRWLFHYRSQQLDKLVRSG